MFLRFEATVGFACRRSELKEVVERFVESASFFSSFDKAPHVSFVAPDKIPIASLGYKLQLCSISHFVKEVSALQN